jgi:hypothetical protein
MRRGLAGRSIFAGGRRAKVGEWSDDLEERVRLHLAGQLLLRGYEEDGRKGRERGVEKKRRKK